MLQFIADRLWDNQANVYDFQRQTGRAFEVTMLNYLDWVAQTKTFESLAAYSGNGVSVGGTGQPEILIGLRVSANFFDTMGVRPACGRAFRSEENERGRDQVMILSHALWQRRYGGDPGIVGRIVPVNDEPFQIVGVMPAGFDFPEKRYDLWMPLALRGGQAAFSNRSAHYLRVVARLRPSGRFAAAVAGMNQITAKPGKSVSGVQSQPWRPTPPVERNGDRGFSGHPISSVRLCHAPPGRRMGKFRGATNSAGRYPEGGVHNPGRARRKPKSIGGSGGS